MEGCVDPLYIDFNPLANVSNQDDCLELVSFGCTDDLYIEYDSSANTDDGSCVTDKVMDVLMTSYLEYYGFVDFTIPIDLSQLVKLSRK